MIIIPARLKSSRFSEKILAPINGIPMCIYVALNAQKADDCAIATDSEEVIKKAKEYNIKAVLTSTKHESGTERLNEAASILGLSDNEIIINLQGDEPLFEVDNIKRFVEFANKHKDECFMASAYKISNDVADENTVKVVLDLNDFAIYFSRANIPFDRDKVGQEYLHHIGIYAYKRSNLKEFVRLNSKLEHIEKLEQLRALENGKKIKMLKLESNSFGIDTKNDYERLLDVIKSKS